MAENDNARKVQQRLGFIQNHLSTGSSDSSFSLTPNLLNAASDFGENIKIGFRTIPEGQAAVLWNWKGQVRLEEGPAVIFCFFENFKLASKFTASVHQYISITYTNGKVENIPGPISMFFNPKEHQNIKVHDALYVPSGYAIVLFRQEQSTLNQNEKVSVRKVIHGPTAYQLKENEQLHYFFWQMPDQKAPTIQNRKLIKFFKIRTIPDSMYFDVESVRTKDDALLQIQLMLFFHLVEPEKMIDNSHDPIGEMINTVSADIVDFVANKTFEEFKMASFHLNQPSTYVHLQERMSRLGYKLNQIVFRGFISSHILQDISNRAIESRTTLRLEEETERQKQDLMDLEQIRSHNRRGQELKMKEQEERAKEEAAQREMRTKIEYLASLKQEGVDLNLLFAPSPSQHIKLSGDIGDLKPKLHFNVDKTKE